MAFFSIIIPSFNAAAHIHQCLDSIGRQICGDYEVVIIDGASTDATLAVIKSIAATNKRIVYTSEKDNGIYDAMNKGINLSGGQWLLFLGADDELLDNKVLTKIKHRLQKISCQVLYGNVKIKGQPSWANDGDIYDGEFDTPKLLKKNICHQAIFYNAEFIKNHIGQYNTVYPLCADWDFNLRCWAKTVFQYTTVVISRFNAGGTTTQQGEDKMFTADFVANIRKYFAVADVLELVQRNKNKKPLEAAPGNSLLTVLLRKVKKRIVRS